MIGESLGKRPLLVCAAKQDSMRGLGLSRPPADPSVFCNRSLRRRGFTVTVPAH